MALAYRQGVRDYGHLPSICVARGASASSEAALEATRLPSADSKGPRVPIPPQKK